MSDLSPIIVWFRSDIRLDDNPALFVASETNRPLILLYIDDSVTPCQHYTKGGALRWWTHYALENFAKQLEDYKAKLIIRQGNPLDILQDIIQKTKATSVYWNRLYAPSEIQRDTHIKTILKGQNIEVKSFKANLLKEPHEITTGEGGFYKVYTPFRRACERELLDDMPIDPPVALFSFTDNLSSASIDEIFPLPQNPDWAGDMRKTWDITEKAAHHRVKDFIHTHLENYKEARDFPSQNATSRLSPYLARGMISPRRILYYVNQAPASKGREHFISELLWREFSAYLLYHFSFMEQGNFRPAWDDFPWENNMSCLKKWQKGQTGIPIIDAGMRELRLTGYMHNRVRMLVGSFLVKHLLIDWRYGEAWFRDNLVDFDVANNIASWQWVAGSGADAAPYFRIFNPVLQSQKFDKDGDYIKKYVPECRDLQGKYIHAPWEASSGELMMAGIILGKNYPAPIMNLEAGRKRALEIYHNLK